MSGLTRQEQKVICVVLLLLLVGWTVKAWRTAHPGSSDRGVDPPAAVPGPVGQEGIEP